MSSASDSARWLTGRTAALTNGEAGGFERRRRPQPSTPDQYLHELPASVLLDRLQAPMLAIGLDGIVVYHNPAFGKMLGHAPDVTLVGYRLSALLDVHPTTPPVDCVKILRGAGQVIVEWHHAEGFPVRSVVSETLFFRASDEILLIGITDITELLWATPPEPRWRE